jgi:hypothetical protein
MIARLRCEQAPWLLPCVQAALTCVQVAIPGEHVPPPHMAGRRPSRPNPGPTHAPHPCGPRNAGACASASADPALPSKPRRRGRTSSRRVSLAADCGVPERRDGAPIRGSGGSRRPRASPRGYPRRPGPQAPRRPSSRACNESPGPSLSPPTGAGAPPCPGRRGSGPPGW